MLFAIYYVIMERGGVWNEAATLGMYWFTFIIKMEIHYPKSVVPSPGVALPCEGCLALSDDVSYFYCWEATLLKPAEGGQEF